MIQWAKHFTAPAFSDSITKIIVKKNTIPTIIIMLDIYYIGYYVGYNKCLALDNVKTNVRHSEMMQVLKH